MKNAWDKFKEAICGVIPLLILFGIPTAIPIAIGIVSIWDDMPQILNRITYLGNGSLVTGILLLLLGLVGLIVAFSAFMLWAKYFLEYLNKKAKSKFWFWFPIVISTFGLYALFKIITKL